MSGDDVCTWYGLTCECVVLIRRSCYIIWDMMCDIYVYYTGTAARRVAFTVNGAKCLPIRENFHFLRSKICLLGHPDVTPGSTWLTGNLGFFMEESWVIESHHALPVRFSKVFEEKFENHPSRTLPPISGFWPVSGTLEPRGFSDNKDPLRTILWYWYH
jgi:hypothetical protein